MEKINTASRIVAKAASLGADLAGIASVDTLKTSPSYRMFDAIGMNQGAVGSRGIDENFTITWPEGAASVLVIAVSHPENAPELDWWRGKGTIGNDRLIKVNKMMSRWLGDTLKIPTWPMPYHIESGGVFLKDAAVLAGLGCIGKNNMLVTPRFGPRVRLRAVLLGTPLPATGPIDFDPCTGCEAPCRSACPQAGFAQTIYPLDRYDLPCRPGRSGCYDRDKCGIQMALDLDTASDNTAGDAWEMSEEALCEHGPSVKYCRRCEFACPVGKAPD